MGKQEFQETVTYGRLRSAAHQSGLEELIKETNGLYGTYTIQYENMRKRDTKIGLISGIIQGAVYGGLLYFAMEKQEHTLHEALRWIAYTGAIFGVVNTILGYNGYRSFRGSILIKFPHIEATPFLKEQEKLLEKYNVPYGKSRPYQLKMELG